MARIKGSTVEAEATTEPQDELVTEATSTEAAAPATETSSKVELTEEQINELVSKFAAEAQVAVDTRDPKTGTLTDEVVAGINKIYAELPTVKVKNAAKRSLNESMSKLMDEMDIVQARAYMELGSKLSAGSAKSGKTRAPREPVDPSEAFIERVAVLNLAYNLATGTPPEGVSADWSEKAATVVSEAAAAADAYRKYVLDESEEKGDGPEVSDVVKAAVKLSLGKSAKPGKSAPKVGGSTSTYDGERRSVANHIYEAFAGKEPGTFLLIADIRNFSSDEYGSDHPSSGAISARLFPSSGKCTLEGVVPATDENGHKGAQKV
jgi:hypothetical protein